MEIDDRKRIRMIASEIERLNKLPIEKIHEWYHSIFDILIYNQNLLFKFAESKREIEKNFIIKIKESCG